MGRQIANFVAWLIHPMWYAFFALLLVYAWQNPSLILVWFIAFVPFIGLILFVTLLMLLIVNVSGSSD